MSWPDPSDTQNPESNGMPEKHGALLYQDDSGELPIETRRVLVQLLAGPYLDGRRHSQLWPILVRDEDIIRRRLSELFLDIVIDLDIQVAFIRQADTGELDTPTLLRRSQLTFIDSVILLYLRQRLTQAETQGDRAVVSMDDIKEFISPYEKGASTDHAGFIKRANASIQKFKDKSILQKIRGSDERLEISPTLKLLFSASEIIVLTEIYKQMSKPEKESVSQADEGDTP